MVKKKVSSKRKKLTPGVNPDRPFPPPPKPKKRKNKTITRNDNPLLTVFNCGICNEPTQVANFPNRKLYICDKCSRGWSGKIVDFFVALKSFLLGK